MDGSYQGTHREGVKSTQRSRCKGKNRVSEQLVFFKL